MIVLDSDVSEWVDRSSYLARIFIVREIREVRRVDYRFRR